MENFKQKCNQNLSMSINYAQNVLEMVTDSYQEATGIDGMVNYVNEQLYKPLAEYKLKNYVNTDQPVFLSVTDGQLAAQINDGTIKL